MVAGLQRDYRGPGAIGEALPALAAARLSKPHTPAIPWVIGLNTQYPPVSREWLAPAMSASNSDAQSAGQLRPDEPSDSEYKYRYIVMPMRI